MSTKLCFRAASRRLQSSDEVLREAARNALSDAAEELRAAVVIGLLQRSAATIGESKEDMAALSAAVVIRLDGQVAHVGVRSDNDRPELMELALRYEFEGVGARAFLAPKAAQLSEGIAMSMARNCVNALVGETGETETVG